MKDIDTILLSEAYGEVAEQSKNNAQQLLSDLEVDYTLPDGTPKLFLNAFVESLPAKFLPIREREIADEMRKAIINIANKALSNKY